MSVTAGTELHKSAGGWLVSNPAVWPAHLQQMYGSRLWLQVQRQELDALRQQHDAMAAAADEAALSRQAIGTISVSDAFMCMRAACPFESELAYKSACSYAWWLCGHIHDGPID